MQFMNLMSKRKYYYILKFNRDPQKNMTLLISVLAFKSFDSAKLNHHYRQLALTGVNYTIKKYIVYSNETFNSMVSQLFLMKLQVLLKQNQVL